MTVFGEGTGGLFGVVVCVLCIVVTSLWHLMPNARADLYDFMIVRMTRVWYKEVLEPWERSELMSQQLAPPIPESTGTAHSAWASSEPLEQQLAAWRHARLLEYSKELGLLERLQAEVLSLRGKVARHQQPGEQPGPPCLRTAPHRPPWTI